ncbi:MAG: hypothetical protein ACUVRV_04830 [Cyanobacteriota bacterium]
MEIDTLLNQRSLTGVLKVFLGQGWVWGNASEGSDLGARTDAAILLTLLDLPQVHFGGFYA